MSGPASGGAGAPRLRRARRDDIGALLAVTGGPEPGRIRALRRILGSLQCDVHLLDGPGDPLGVVAVGYRRSVAEGGLVATVDLLCLLGDGGSDPVSALETLAACAFERARRRGCVAIEIEFPDLLGAAARGRIVPGDPAAIAARHVYRLRER